MDYKIINRVSKSKIITIDFNDFLGHTIFEVIDLKNWLKDEFILVNEENWEFDDECQFSEDDDCELYFILDDPKRAAVFKKDRSGFPILLTDLK